MYFSSIHDYRLWFSGGQSFEAISRAADAASTRSCRPSFSDLIDRKIGCGFNLFGEYNAKISPCVNAWRPLIFDRLGISGAN
jgi:hypothetical protein